MQDFQSLGVDVDLSTHRPLMAEVMAREREKKKKLKRLPEKRQGGGDKGKKNKLF